MNSPSLASHTVFGALWAVIQVVLTKGMALITHGVLGWILLEDDYALYGRVLIFVVLSRSLQRAGLRKLLIQRGSSEYEELVGPVFWLSVVASLAIAGLFVSGSYGLAVWFQDPRVIPLVLIIALAGVVMPPGQVLNAELSVNLRFKALSAIQLGSNFVRLAGAIVLAVNGFGAASLLWPLVAMGFFEMLVPLMFTHTRPWRLRPGLTRWPDLLREGKWVFLFSIAAGLTTNGDYLVFGRVCDPLVFGVYVFGYQISVQMAMLTGPSIQNVLFPALSKLSDQPGRQAEAFLRAVRVMILLTAPGLMLMAVIFEPLELLIWQGKWANSVAVVYWLSIGLAFSILANAVRSIFEARGEFRVAFWAELTRGLTLVLTAVVLAFVIRNVRIDDQVAIIARGLGFMHIVSGLGLLVYASLRTGLSVRRVMTMALARYLVALVPLVLIWYLNEVIGDRLSNHAMALVFRIAILSSAFVVVYITLVKLFFRDDTQYVMERIRKTQN